MATRCLSLFFLLFSSVLFAHVLVSIQVAYNAINAFEGLVANWWRDEERHYEETYHDESDDDDWDAGDIPTADLKEHNYRDLRVLQDYFDKLEVLLLSLFATC